MAYSFDWLACGYEQPAGKGGPSASATVLRMILRRTGALFAVLCLALVTTGCGGVGPLRQDSANPGAPAVSVGPAPPTGRASVAATDRRAGPRSLTVMQTLRSGGETRILEVEAGGRWTCEACAGAGTATSGTLTAAQIQELQRLLADPALAEENDLERRYRPACHGRLLSTLLTGGDVVSWQDCDVPPPTAAAIVRLLAAAAPIVSGTPAA
jgi:hypothetical protein